MALQAGLLDTGLPTRVLSQTKVDLSTPVNMFTSLQANKRANRADKRAQSLADLKLTKEEQATNRKTKFQEIMQSSLTPNGHIDTERVIPLLNQGGFQEEAYQIQDRKNKAQAAKQEAESKAGLELATMSDAVLSSSNPVDAFMIARDEAVKKGLPVSQGFLNYFPTDEEIVDGRLDPRVQTELQYLSEKSVRPKGPMSLEDKMYLMNEKYKKMKEVIQTRSDVKVDQPLTESEKSKERISKQKVGIDYKKLSLAEEEGDRKAEKFEQEKIDTARKDRAYIQKNKSQYDNFQRFVDKADSILDNPNMAYVSGMGRYHPTKGSETIGIESVGKDLQADIDFITDMGVIETMAKLKAESPTGSTGFGALSTAEMQTMKNAFSLLGNPKISANKKKDEVKKVRDIMAKRAVEIRSYMDKVDSIAGPEKTIEDELFEQNNITDEDIEGF